jgi:hypothetical protein
MTLSYSDFLQSKAQDTSNVGFVPKRFPDFLFDFQASLYEWNCRKGRSLTAADCGMGKSPLQLAWGDAVVQHTNRPVLILTPLAVAQQTLRQSEKFGIDAKRCNDGHLSGVRCHITNYEKLHHFDPSYFSGVVCDESSCIKAMNGARRAQVTEFLRTIPYRLLCTATAAPNDYIELGTASEALGVMGQTDMLSRFFKNDQNVIAPMRYTRFGAPRRHEPVGGHTDKWRFKGHAEIPFWRWAVGWMRAGRKPSDFGPFSDERFVLPPLIEREHIVETRTLPPGKLFAVPATNMQEEREERRRTIGERCERAAELVRDTGKPFVIWCQLNPEGDLLERLIPDAIQVSGNDSDEAKEEAYEAFVSGQSRGIITKHKIGGWGLNWEHCPHVVEFATHSWEAHYQGVRRCWRFGQTQQVVNDIIYTEGQRSIKENMARKAAAADRMFTKLVEFMNDAIKIEAEVASASLELPSWI